MRAPELTQHIFPIYHLDMSRKSTPYALLGLLSIEPMSGYDIRREMRESLSFFWNESYGQIYPALKRLWAQGLVAPATNGPKDGRDRQAYTLTSKGRANLRKWLGEPPRQTPVSNEFLLKLFLGRLAPKGACCEHIHRHVAQCRQLLAHYENIRKIVSTERRGHPDLKFWLILLDHGISMRRAEIRWCIRSLRDLRPASSHGGTRGEPLTA
jgi:DNA-binding PadR family transcriptional regulator